MKLLVKYFNCETSGFNLVFLNNIVQNISASAFSILIKQQVALLCPFIYLDFPGLYLFFYIRILNKTSEQREKWRFIIISHFK